MKHHLAILFGGLFCLGTLTPATAEAHALVIVHGRHHHRHHHHHHYSHRRVWISSHFVVRHHHRIWLPGHYIVL